MIDYPAWKLRVGLLSHIILKINWRLDDDWTPVILIILNAFLAELCAGFFQMAVSHDVTLNPSWEGGVGSKCDMMF